MGFIANELPPSNHFEGVRIHPNFNNGKCVAVIGGTKIEATKPRYYPSFDCNGSASQNGTMDDADTKQKCDCFYRVLGALLTDVQTLGTANGIIRPIWALTSLDEDNALISPAVTSIISTLYKRTNVNPPTSTKFGTAPLGNPPLTR
ncbi:hypothetical protein BDN71DRAFT_1512965 [Pleurotus eryngii]|uniref:Uncharacterized protein n=1 Tax=Pleurotus eryngii TaxID=5323 RepID=A0A9P5ZI75_PLEER|nr:hypothetical protein BDN71DRAFT_1512965 [Pleurotus eryngii]